MRGQWGSLMSRVFWAVALLGSASLLRPGVAEAQARGTLQVIAQVVDTKAGMDGLEMARAALRAKLTVPRRSDAVPTLAHVSLSYATEQRPAVVVTIDYSSN